MVRTISIVRFLIEWRLISHVINQMYFYKSNMYFSIVYFLDSISVQNLESTIYSFPTRRMKGITENSNVD